MFSLFAISKYLFVKISSGSKEMIKKKVAHCVPINATHDSIIFSFYWLKNFVTYSCVTNVFVKGKNLIDFPFFFLFGLIFLHCFINTKKKSIRSCIGLSFFPIVFMHSYCLFLATIVCRIFYFWKTKRKKEGKDIGGLGLERCLLISIAYSQTHKSFSFFSQHRVDESRKTRSLFTANSIQLIRLCWVRPVTQKYIWLLIGKREKNG